MLSNSLTDTRLEFLQGSVILDSIDAPADPAIALTYKQSQIRLPKHGAFRLDSDTEVLRAYSGEAEVLPAGGKPVSVDNTHLYFFTLGLTEKFMDRSDDEFYDWAKDRHEAISSQNQLAQDALDSSQGDPDATAPAPNFGNSPLYGSAPPYPIYPSSPSYPSYAVTDPNLWMTGGGFDPFFGLNNFPNFQTFVFIPVRGYWWTHRPDGHPGLHPPDGSLWTHRPDRDKTHWPGLNTTRPGRLASSISSRPLTVRMPAIQPRPFTPARVFPTTMRPSGHIYARPAPAPHFNSAPVGAHAIGHR